MVQGGFADLYELIDDFADICINQRVTEMLLNNDRLYRVQTERLPARVNHQNDGETN
ncbi:MAG: hypothetical protein AAF202_09445 [Pseudomonadota bacterium]